jgi:NADH-quinone oxidoreductase subunit N
MSNLDSFSYIVPEFVLAGTLVVLFLLNFFTSKKEIGGLYASLALLGIVLSLVFVCSSLPQGSATLFFGMLHYDALGVFFKYVFGIAACLALIFSQASRDLADSDKASYYMLILVLLIGMNFLSMSANLLMLYLSFEMVSISSYILTGYAGGRRSSEAALKYVIYGGVASGAMLYGFSLLFGLTGSLQISEIAEFLRFNPVDRLVLFLALILSLAGFGFKIAAFPFHMWSPDVYEGAPTPFTAFLSVGPKAAGFAVLLRFIFGAFFWPEGGGYVDIKMIGVSQVIAVLAAASMTYGNLVALRQENIKRMLAYSSIAHAGYMLMGLAAVNHESIEALLFYMVVYLLMNLGAFLVVIIVANQFATEEISGYSGLAKRNASGAWLAVAMTVFLFSLAGIPPTAGFIGKFYLFGAVMKQGLYWVAIVGALNSVVSLYYYVRIVKNMFFDEPATADLVTRPGFRLGTALGALSILTIYFGLFWQGLAEWVAASASFVR